MSTDLHTELPATHRTSGSVFRRIAARYIIPAVSTASTGPRCAFDIEANGLLDAATKVHCIVIANLDGDQIDEYGPEQISAALEHLARADYLIGHNICNYDLPLLRRLHGWAPASGCAIVDTLIAGRLILPNLSDLDDQAAAMGDPKLGKLRGRYSIEAWGARFGMPKVGADLEDWSKWTPEMQARCVQDTLINKRLWQFLQPDGYSQYALELEMRVAPLCDAIAAAGVYFDRAAAAKLRQQWSERRGVLEAQLAKQFPGTNLNSRKQIGELLEARGWVPEARTEKTKKPKIDDETLETIAVLYPEFAGLSEHYILGRRLGQLINGDKAWMKSVSADGRIHGGIVHIGTPHSRAKHLEPNLAQVPNPKRGKPFATECRSLFKARDGWVLVACDQATLQDRGFAHYLAEFDDGAYAKDFLAGMDTHWRTATALSLVNYERNKESKVDTVIREGSKGFRYAFLYGAGVLRAGLIIAGIVRAVRRLDPASDLPNRFFNGEAHPKESALRRVGRQALDRFEAATPGLQKLRSKLQTHAQRHGWLPGLDGRRVPVRALYSALNFIVTSSEAIICKRWLVRAHDELRERFRYGWDGDVVICLWVHDEIVCCCRPSIAKEVGEIMVRHAKEPSEFYDFKVALDADYKIGCNWAGEPIEGVAPAEAPSTKPEPDEAPIADAVEPTEQHDDIDADADSIVDDDNGDAELDVDNGDADVVVETPIPGLGDAIRSVREFIAAVASGQPHNRDNVTIKPRDNGDAGNGAAARLSFSSGNGHFRYDYQNAHEEKQPDKPYGPIRTRLLSQGYRVTRTFPFMVPGEAAPRFYEDRYDLRSGITPTKARPRKTSRYWRQENGKSINGTGPRRVIFNWPAIVQANPEIAVFITEGANKSAPLNQAGLLATAAPYHQWGSECIAALAGRHLIYHEDHDLPDENGRVKAKELSADACNKLMPIAASFRIVPALQLWKNLKRNGEPPHGWDVKDWLEQGGNATTLLDICREAPEEGAELNEWDAGDLLGQGLPPPRQWIYGKQLCRCFSSSLVAPGDIGKTTMRLTQAIELATGHELLGHRIYQRCRVLVVTLEDDRNELWRRLLAICQHHHIDPAELKGWLFCADPNGAKLVEQINGERVLGELEPMLRKAIERRQPELVTLDPFVKLHALDENSNPDMDFVCSQLVKLAQEYNIALDSPAHTRKGALIAGDSDNRRGASAQRDAGRLDYTLTAMSEAEAEQFGIEFDERKSYIRLDRAKANIVRAIKATWYRLVNVSLGNVTELYPEGDEVQALEAWVPPDAWLDLDAGRINRILDKIDAGLPDGNRYSGARSAKKRAAWKVIVEEMPEKAEAQAREIIRAWLKSGLLVGREYENPIDRKSAEGLFVDPAKRPTA